MYEGDDDETWVLVGSWDNRRRLAFVGESMEFVDCPQRGMAILKPAHDCWGTTHTPIHRGLGSRRASRNHASTIRTSCTIPACQVVTVNARVSFRHAGLKMDTGGSVDFNPTGIALGAKNVGLLAFCVRRLGCSPPSHSHHQHVPPCSILIIT